MSRNLPLDRRVRSPRPLLRLALVFLAIAACGTGEEAGPQVEAAVCAAGQIDGDLRLHLPDDILPPEIAEDFAARFGVTVDVTTYADADELIGQLETRVVPHDLTVATDRLVDIMRRDGLVVPLSLDAIPARTNLMPVFADPPYDPGSVHSVPLIWGTVGLGVNVNVAGAAIPDTWSLVFDPATSDRFAGRISLLDDARMAVGGALKYLGYSLNTTDPGQIEEAAELLAATEERLAGFITEEHAQELVNGQVDVAQGFSDAFFEAFQEADAWDDYTYVVPREGSVLTVDAFVVPITAEHPCTAHTFVDYVLDPERGASVAVWNRSATANQASSDRLAPLREDPRLYPPEETMLNLEFMADVGEAQVEYVDALERARNG